MKQVRYNIFETNSSSTHVFSFNEKEDSIPIEELRNLVDFKDTIYDVDGSLSIYFKEYGWSGPDIINTHDKLMYVAQLILTGPFYIPNNSFSLKTDNDVKLFIDKSYECSKNSKRKVLKERINVLFNLFKRIDPGFDRNKNPVYITSSSFEDYIDHQSCIFFDYLKEDFTDALLDKLAEFILNPKTCIIITNDNNIGYDDEEIFKHECNLIELDTKVVFDPHKIISDKIMEYHKLCIYIRDNLTGSRISIHKNVIGSGKNKPIVYTTVIDGEEFSINSNCGVLVVCNYTNKVKKILEKNKVEDYILINNKRFNQIYFFDKDENNMYNKNDFLLKVSEDKSNLIFLEKK